MLSAKFRAAVLGLLALSLDNSRQLVRGSALSLTNASPAGALGLALRIPSRTWTGTQQLRGEASCLALRGGVEKRSESDSNVSGLTDVSFDTHTPSEFEALDFTAEDMAGVPTGLSKEQVMQEMLDGRPEMMLPAHLNRTKASGANKAVAGENASDSGDSEDEDDRNDSAEYLHGIEEVRDGTVRLFPYLVLGGGNAAGYALKELLGPGGVQGKEVCLISDEKYLPYERPALSKGYMLGKAPSPENGGFLCNSEKFYAESGIDARLCSRVTKVDLARRLLFVESTRFGKEWEDVVAFKKLLFATGCRPRALEVPGASLRNILYCRNVEDVDRITKLVQSPPGGGEKANALVVGGGYIGLEVSACLAQLGVPTTLLVRGEHLLPHLFTAEMSVFFERLWAEKGVAIIKGHEVARFEGMVGNVTTAVLEDGQELACDICVVGIGSVPNAELLREAGVKVDGRGAVLVDEELRTSARDVWAVGDVVAFPAKGRGGEQRQQEHVTHARASGAFAAKAMADGAGSVGDAAQSAQSGEVYTYLPMFYSRVDAWGLSWRFFGEAVGEVKVVGDVQSGTFSAFWIQGSALIGALHCTLGASDAGEGGFAVLRRIVESKAELSAAALAAFSLCPSLEEVEALLAK